MDRRVLLPVSPNSCLVFKDRISLARAYQLYCAGYLSDPPGVMGVETTTLELEPLSASNLLAIDRTQ